MKIWVDADACPKAVKDILFRVAQKRRIPMTLVANSPMVRSGIGIHRLSPGGQGL